MKPIMAICKRMWKEVTVRELRLRICRALFEPAKRKGPSNQKVYLMNAGDEIRKSTILKLSGVWWVGSHVNVVS